MWAVFQKAFYDSRRTLIGLSLGLGIFAFAIVALFPTIAEVGDTYQDLADELPAEVLSMMGDSSGSFDFSDPVIWLNVEFLTWAVLILGGVVLLQAFNAVTNAERDGTMDLMMSFPIPRRDMLVARFANTILTLLVVLTTIFIALVAGKQLWPEFDIPLGDLAGMVYGSLLILVPHAAFTYMVVALVPSGKRWAGGLAYFAFFGVYLLYGLSGISDATADLQPLMLFDYYNGQDIAANGLDIANVLIMGTVAVLFAGVAWWRIDHKELGV